MSQPAGPPAALPATTPLPGWLGPIVSVTTQVGVPTVVAGVLLWFVLFRVSGTLETIQKAEEERVEILAAMQDTLIAALDRQGDKFVAVMEKNIEQNKRTSEALERLDRRDTAP